MAFDFRKEYHRYKRYYLNLLQYYEKPATKVSTSLILTFATIAFFVFFAIQPTATTISKLFKEIENKKETSARLTKKITTLAAAQEEYLSVEEDVWLVEAALPKDTQISRLVRELEYVAQLNGFLLGNLRFGDFKLYDADDQSQDRGMIELSFGGKTDYAKAKVLVEDITNLSRVIRLDTFSLNTSKEPEEIGLLTLTIKAEAYYLGTDSAKLKEVEKTKE